MIPSMENLSILNYLIVCNVIIDIEENHAVNVFLNKIVSACRMRI